MLSVDHLLWLSEGQVLVSLTPAVQRCHAILTDVALAESEYLSLGDGLGRIPLDGPDEPVDGLGNHVR